MDLIMYLIFLFIWLYKSKVSYTYLGVVTPIYYIVDRWEQLRHNNMYPNKQRKARIICP